MQHSLEPIHNKSAVCEPHVLLAKHRQENVELATSLQSSEHITKQSKQNGHKLFQYVLAVQFDKRFVNRCGRVSVVCILGNFACALEFRAYSFMSHPTILFLETNACTGSTLGMQNRRGNDHVNQLACCKRRVDSRDACRSACRVACTWVFNVLWQHPHARLAFVRAGLEAYFCQTFCAFFVVDNPIARLLTKPNHYVVVVGLGCCKFETKFESCVSKSMISRVSLIGSFQLVCLEHLRRHTHVL